ncbi:MAG: phenylalanine--tRNA ligase subunit beta [Flavobacteriaceae bacterium]|nr:phenylalanine--tRNA ligase subunit beta [Flavobacteriaceae bacterium]
MKISYKWLQKYLPIDLDIDKASEILTDLGLEVEGVETIESIKGSLKGIVVGKVLTCEKHPNADRLHVATVDLGNGEPVQIVCGAPNVAKNQTVPVATVGTILYDEKGEAFKIKKSKIRGEESFGMICAEDELGLGKSHDGIMILDSSLKAGTPASEVFNIESDYAIEIGLTPNRADAMSHLGVARDLRAGLLQQGITSELITPSVSDFYVEERTFKIDIDVQDTVRAPRYVGLTITDIKIEESPEWLQNRLKAIGLTPINNVVDITNFVLHDLGQPLHAFDANKILKNKVIVKTLKEGTKFTTLDGVERSLHQEDLMICDGEENPMCIAGVFGGIESGITQDTTSVFLESAYFNPVSIRKTAKRHTINSDASFRFERGIDPNITEYAIKRAAILIKDLAGGKISSEIIDIYPNKIEDFQIFLSYERMNKLIGHYIDSETIQSILVSLDIKINNHTESGLNLTIPAYRVDVVREVDVIEEILRVYGYNNVEFSEKLNMSITFSEEQKNEKVQNIAATQLINLGFYETMANSLTKPDYTSYSNQINDEANVTILNPLSQDLSVLRQSMLFSGLEAVSFNINRKNKTLKLFEFGKTYHKFNDKYQEEKHLSLFVTGSRLPSAWNAASQQSDFFYFKGIVTVLLKRMGLIDFKSKPTKNDVFSEGLSFSLGKIKLVDFGVVRADITKGCAIKQEVFYADFNWTTLLKLTQNKTISVTLPPKFPEVKRDLALLIDDEVRFLDVYNLAKQTECHYLKSVDLFDVYQGKNLPEGKKSYAVSFVLEDTEKTLEEKQIESIMSKLQKALESKLGASLR